MRKHPIAASATLALLIGAVAACGGSPSASASPASTCVNASAPHHAYIVVQHGAGARLQKCVGFSGDTIDGKTLMDQSRIEFQSMTFTFGEAICQIDNEPAQFTKCFADNGPNWSLFIDTGGAWTVAQTGYTQVTLHDREALGWLYTADQSASPPPLPKE
ncbi:MAG TPA: hypothetical protein VJR46_11410 [Candidatus Dormibacteraeota bacterium]|nr:hypothetical protein [Candidatus Dormibacteraeota bacterium]